MKLKFDNIAVLRRVARDFCRRWKTGRRAVLVGGRRKP